MTRKPETGNLKPELSRKNSLLTQVSRFRFQPSERSGLTLIEVMLALVILGIGLTVLISTASKCLAVVKQSRNYETARHLLAVVELEFQNKIMELEPDQDLEDGAGEVQFPDESQYKGVWEVATEGDEKDGLKKVTFRVSWSERGANPCEEVVTYRYVPQKKKGGTVTTPQ